MSLLEQIVYVIPAETARVARAAFPKGNVYLKIADELGSLYQDREFLALFPRHGQPAYSPVRLALVTVVQFAEGLSDRQAADGVRSRIDWKYLLGLELTDAGFDHTVLSEFRSRLVAGKVEEQLLNRVLEIAKEMKLLKGGGRQRTDSTHVIGAVRNLNRLERVGETMRVALNQLAVMAPDWLREQALPEWYERYEHRVENYRLPKTAAGREQWGMTIGSDGYHLLEALDRAIEMPSLNEIPAVKVLRRVWAEQYVKLPKVQLRPVTELAASGELITSPHDPEVRWSHKRHIEWAGYKVHLTETCDAGQPHLITHVETTPATTPDDNMLEPIHVALQQQELLPREHLVDKGYTDAETLLESQQKFGITVLGPVAADPSWQARAEKGFDLSHFTIDWEAHRVTCPTGKSSFSWRASQQAEFEVRFASQDCLACPFQSDCTTAKDGRRTLKLHNKELFQTLQAARKRQKTPEFQAQYAPRAAIEGTLSQGIRRCGLRYARYLGLVKVHLQHLLTATALNLIRMAEWLLGTPHAKTRCSPFAALKPTPL